MKIPGGRSDWSILEQDRIIGENESMKRRVKEMRNIIVVMAGALVLSLLGAARGSFKDGTNWSLVQFNSFLKDALLDERDSHRDTKKRNYRLAVEIMDLEEKFFNGRDYYKRNYGVYR
jgi:hypothetical protein